MDHEYIHTKTIETPGFIARIFQPVLTEDEHKRRMNAIHNRAAELIKAAQIKK